MGRCSPSGPAVESPLQESQRSYVTRHPRRQAASSKPEQFGRERQGAIAVIEMAAGDTTA
ncbi:TPA: hypothetical protein ACQJWS_005548 [Citrobacter freundii]